MKILKFLVFLTLVTVLLAASGPISAKGDMIKKVSQIVQLYYDNGNWKRVMPDGSIVDFELGTGQTFIMTGAYIRFYANEPDSGPYRFYLKAPNNTNLWLRNLSNITYPGSSTVYGGGLAETLETGIPISVQPTLVVKQLPPPPANPNSGNEISGTFYMRVTGYIAY